jgi:FtsP/CotA-like multicopper oxidase with cupredoxin domain
LNSNKHLIPFTVIGTDTTIFNKAINGVDFLNFGPAERVDLLIRFDVDLPFNVNNVYFVCDDMNEGATVIKYQFTIESSPQTILEKIAQILPNKDNILTISEGEIVSERMKLPQDYQTLNIPFTNLSTIPEDQIVVRRNRPLFSLPYDTRFMIGAHYMFEDGSTDLPKIGTIDDFYMINNLWEDHPMHIHLINHQAVKAYSLKRLPENPNCTLYTLDFFRFSGLKQFQGLSNI